MKLIQALTLGSLVLFMASCGAVKDKVNEVTNAQRIKGHWLMTNSEHGGTVENFIENESVVLTFKDDKAAFSPTDSVRGVAVFATIPKCTAGPRNYTTENNDLVLPANPDCGEKRVTVSELSDTTLKFPDPETPDVTRVFVKIDEAKYEALVKASERRP